MKKSLLALAVLGAFAGSASAQSSVTMYGWLDIGYQYNKQFAATGCSASTVNPTTGVTTCNAGKTTYGQEGVSSIAGGYWNGNRWGVRGSEAISPNLNAIFQLEAGFSLDTGAQASSSSFFNRQAYLGLSGNWGAVVLGRLASPSSGTGAFDMFGAVDPFETGWGINSLGSTFISANSLRADNAIAYVSPVWSGFKFAGGYSTNTSGQETAPSNSNTTWGNLSASFTWRDLYVVATYDLFNFASQNGTTGAPITPDRPNQSNLQLGASYDFKVVKIYGAFADQSKISTLNGQLTDVGGNAGLSLSIPAWAAGNYDNNAWMLGVSVPIAGNKYGTVRASYQQSNAKNIQRTINGTNVSWEPDYDVWGLGYSYDLSNRTRLYAGYGQRTLKSNSDAVSQGLAVPAGVDAKDVFDRYQFALGLNHRF